jgi:hypothetical protein
MVDVTYQRASGKQMKKINTQINGKRRTAACREESPLVNWRLASQD